jgi:omega-amidase
MKPFTLAVCQNKPSYNKEENVRRALDLLDRAARHGADLVVLPEMFYYPYEFEGLARQAEQKEPALDLLRERAKAHGIFVCTGSMVEKRDEKLYNTAYLLDPRGDVILKYSKTHLFDVELPGLAVKESAVFTAGDGFGAAACELGTIGMLICYDIRFPETARMLSLKGAEIILVPAAFNTVTGPAHWELTFRARAVENQCFIAAASPARNKKSRYRAYGHSMIIDPWGRVLAQAGTGERIIYARLDPGVLADTRARLPLLRHRRGDLYKHIGNTD